jgi:hypothetical protein
VADKIDFGHHRGDRWGRYAVMLLIEDADFLMDDPESGGCIANELPKWQRYDNARFEFKTEDRCATMSLEIPVARSVKAAVGEANDALYRVVIACVREPGPYKVKTLSVTLLREGM